MKTMKEFTPPRDVVMSMSRRGDIIRSDFTSEGPHTMNILGKLSALFRPENVNEVDEEGALIDQVVNATEPAIASVAGYREVLLPAVRHALDHYTRVVQAIPGPITVSHQSYRADPLVKALFPSHEEITAALGRSIEVREAIKSHAASNRGSVCALLGMRMRTGDGRRPSRDCVEHTDFAATANLLADHTFRDLAADEDEVRQALRDAAFKSLVKSFASEIKSRQREMRLLKTDRDVSQEFIRVGHDHHHHVVKALDQHLERHAEDLSPEGTLLALVDWLWSPESHLRLEADAGHGVTHIQQGPGSVSSEQHLHLPLLATTDRRQWLVCITRVPIEEAMQAVAQETRAHRYIMV